MMRMESRPARKLAPLISLPGPDFTEGPDPDLIDALGIDALADEVATLTAGSRHPNYEVSPDFLHAPDGTAVPIRPVARATVTVVPTPPKGEFRLGLAAEQPKGWSLFQFEDPTRGSMPLLRVERSDGKAIAPGPMLWTAPKDAQGRNRFMIHLMDHDGTGNYQLVYKAQVDPAAEPPRVDPFLPLKSKTKPATRPERARMTWHSLEDSDEAIRYGTRGLASHRVRVT